MSDKILVTGVTGDVGKAVMNGLIDLGSPAKAAARNLEKVESTGFKKADVVLFDYDRPETFEPALAGIDRLFVVPPPLTMNWHELIEPLVDTAIKAGVRHIVNLSQMGAEDIEGLPMRMAEQYIEKTGIAYTHLRPNWFMQTYNNTVLEGSKDQAGIRVPAGDGKASFIDMRDIASVAVAALTSDNHMNRIYTLTGSEALDHHTVVKMLSEETGKPIEYVPVSDEDMRVSLKSASLTDEQIKLVTDLYQLLRQGSLARVSPDVANILGRKPTTFEQYAHDYADSWK